MFTLIVCLAVVALSGAVVLRIVLGEEAQPATLPRPSRGQPPSPRGEEAPAPPPRPAPTGGGAALPRHPVRSAVVLALLLATLGAVLALLIALALGLLVTGVRAGVG